MEGMARHGVVVAGKAIGSVVTVVCPSSHGRAIARIEGSVNDARSAPVSLVEIVDSPLDPGKVATMR